MHIRRTEIENIVTCKTFNLSPSQFVKKKVKIQWKKAKIQKEKIRDGK